MKASEVAKTFSLAPAQLAQLRLVARDKSKATLADQLHKAAIAKPSAREECKVQLLALIAGQGASLPSSAPIAPSAPIASKAIAFVWTQAGGVVAYVPGAPIPLGAKVCYVGEENAPNPWQDYYPAPVASVPGAPAAPVVAPAETRVNVDENAIPVSAVTGYRLPYVIGANVSADGAFYAQFGCKHGKPFNRCSLNLVELLELLQSPAHVADMVRTLQTLKTRLGG